MSRIGKSPIQLPSGVNVSVDADNILVEGPKGKLNQFTMPGITLNIGDKEILVERADETKIVRSKHGLMRSLVNNMIEGVSQGFSKKLEINGVGYRVAQTGDSLKFNLGFSHDVIYKLPAGVTASIEQNTITISGISKQQVGQVSAEIRALKKPEPYKGKGIKYADERLIRKSGKSGKESA